ncbi:Hypothetical protein SA1_75127 [Staphylococcus aureus subsp. aureus PSP1996]|uniref:Uncharacterized protein n=1 Tax=Staphylococcus aureus (strain NCTC 8325 / PS 47) TaxID=93061 RepID=Q2FUR4_STAA8|nr:hypothetical protein SAOUHSC_03038 [Staphylococcus aureus subsp. aureus NCTC 8325]EFW33246.1 hypothetical protein HMPREF9528_00350 [Staphylococcus aureus subsp. aureus MRSA131]EFW35981.1 hypothetical protein HMPREF9529_00272 [Staphylococcus aureus subsp. aureus MRSA177]ESR29145.1 Hypothetical protein SA1_75127 [Staphylococcus aureus subsp. aureus PSP1996]KXA37230.1 hypothetical protein HMPREF3211_01003 [Staphylococcus aureus]
MPIIGVVNELNTITSIVKAMTLYQVTVKFFKSSYDCFTNSLNFMIQSLLFLNQLIVILHCLKSKYLMKHLLIVSVKWFS